VVGVAARVVVGVGRGLRGEVAGAHAVGGMALAEEVHVHARHDAEERALAGAVGSKEADLRAGIEREPDALQDLPLGRHDLAEILHEEDELMSHRLWIIPVAPRFSLTNHRAPTIYRPESMHVLRR